MLDPTFIKIFSLCNLNIFFYLFSVHFLLSSRMYAYMARVVHLLVSEVHVIYRWNEIWGNPLVGWWSQWICHDVTRLTAGYWLTTSKWCPETTSFVRHMPLVKIKVNIRQDKVFKNEPSKICGTQPLKNLKEYGLLIGNPNY